MIARSEVRALLLAIAGLGVLTNTVGALFALQTGPSLSAWQLNCLGVGLPTAVVGTLAAWHQPRNRIAWLFLSASVGFGLEQLGLAVLANPTSANWAQAAAYAMLLVTPGPLTTIWVLLVLLFPDGQFSRPVWRLYALMALAVALIASLVELLIAPPGYLPLEYHVAAPIRLAGPFATFSSGLPIAVLDLPGVLLPALALLALLDRYRHARGTVQQQIKWLLFAVSLQVAILLLFFPLLWLGVEEPALVSLLVAPLPTIGAALAIFKYRLWEVDRLLLRTLVFAAFWLVSSAGFLGLAAVAGLAIGGMDLRLLAAVTLSLMAALALQPIRARLEARIRLLVYGPRPRGYTALARLGEREQVPGALPVGRLAELIAAVARDAVGVDWTSVWLRMEVDKRSLLRLVGEARAEPSPESDSGRVELELWGDQAEPPSLAALLPQPVGAVLPLETTTELVGFLACGQRDARELSADDYQVLAVIARQAAVLLRHGRLEEELRERLDELRESRQRLVTSQDEQRRRLERDLHDGVQQQLVSLAARMRQLSRLGSASRPAELESLADQAEEAVFAMQDLARGIYPSVLADQGLAAALRAQAARLPLELRLDVEPGLADARFERESEACLYFVAMEALTNAQKHANCSAVTVSMHSRPQPRGLVLEVHDNGRGFRQSATPVSAGRHSGSGLQNMRDRLAALGGQLDVRSAPGAGTWIVANLPVRAEILPFQRPGIVSRR